MIQIPGGTRAILTLPPPLYPSDHIFRAVARPLPVSALAEGTHRARFFILRSRAIHFSLSRRVSVLLPLLLRLCRCRFLPFVLAAARPRVRVGFYVRLTKNPMKNRRPM